jgi:hypothetical protein
MLRNRFAVGAIRKTSNLFGASRKFVGQFSNQLLLLSLLLLTLAPLLLQFIGDSARLTNRHLQIGIKKD